MTGNVYIGNRGGIPAITTTPTISTSNVIITLPNHIFRFLGTKGLCVINLTTAIQATPTTLPILISVNDNTLPLTDNEGNAVTVANMANILTFQIYFDKILNVVRILTAIA